MKTSINHALVVTEKTEFSHEDIVALSPLSPFHKIKPCRVMFKYPYDDKVQIGEIPPGKRIMLKEPISFRVEMIPGGF